MMGKYPCRVLHPFGNHLPGQIIFPPAMLRNQLLRGGFIVIVEPLNLMPAPEHERATITAPEKRGRGRPRKVA